MKARKKAGVIEVVQYFSRSLDQHPAIQHDASGAFVFNKPQNTNVRVHDGDYIRVDNPEDIYPINAEYFKENYDVVDSDDHRARHMQLHRAFDELYADFVRHHPGDHDFLQMPIERLLQWSHEQTINPTEMEV
jgi:hypothetical protein